MKKMTMLAVLLAGVTFLSVGCGTNTKETGEGVSNGTPPAPSQGAQPKQEVPAEQIEVKLYIPNADATGVTEEKTKIAEETSDAKKAQTLFDLLKKKGSVPEPVLVKGAVVEGDVLKIDFNSAVTNLQGAATETMFVEAVNRTMFANLPNVNKIQYTIEGKAEKALTSLSIADGFNRADYK